METFLYRLPLFGRLLRAMVLFGWSENMVSALNAGTPTDRALTLSAASSPSRWLRVAAADIAEGVRAGRTLTDGVLRHVNLFGYMVVDLVSAGEAGGQLPQQLNYITSRILSRQVLKELLVLPVGTAKDGVAEVAAAFPTPEAVDQYCALVAIPRNQIQVYVANVARLDQMAQTIYSDDDGGYSPLPNVERLFLEATRKDASDIHLKVGDQPRFRIHGQTIAQPYEFVTAEWMEREPRRIAGDRLVDHVWAHFNADMAWQVGETTFRLNYGVDEKGLTLADRRLSEQIPSMEKSLRVPESTNSAGSSAM